jgi:transposase-like protein
MSGLWIGLAMLGCSGAYATWNARFAYRWLARMACPRCHKRALVVYPPGNRDGGTRFRCTSCSAQLYRYRGKLIDRAAFEAGAREPFPEARLR